MSSVDSYILLSHERKPVGWDNPNCYSGYLTVAQGNGAHSKHFDEVSYAKMMTFVHEALQDNPELEVRVARTDAQIPSFLRLTKEERELLRTDPTQYINTTTVPDITVVVRGVHRPNLPSLQSGHEILADAFGEAVYVSARGSEPNGYVSIESPITGRWASQKYGTPFEGISTIYLFHWIVLSTQELLASKHSRFYLPRAWNPNRSGWISRDPLNDLLVQFRKNKALVESEI